MCTWLSSQSSRVRPGSRMGPLKPRREGEAQTAVRVCLGGHASTQTSGCPRAVNRGSDPSSTRSWDTFCSLCALEELLETVLGEKRASELWAHPRPSAGILSLSSSDNAMACTHTALTTRLTHLSPCSVRPAACRSCSLQTCARLGSVSGLVPGWTASGWRPLLLSTSWIEEI